MTNKTDAINEAKTTEITPDIPAYMLNKKRPDRKVYIEKRGRHDSERYVAVNGKRMIVQCGKEVTVPAEFAEVIEHSCAQDKLSDDFIAQNRVSD